MSHLDVIGLGASTIDLVSLVDHLPATEEIQRAEAMTVQGGGPVATAMVTLARLGANVAMLDQIGDDWRGSLILEEYQSEGVRTNHIKISPGCASSTACVLVRKQDGARTIVYNPGNAPELAPVDVPHSVIESARFLHINGRHWDAALQAIEYAHAANVQVSFDGGAHLYHPEFKHLVPLTDICIVARDFAERYTQETDLCEAATALLDSGPGLVVITDGIRGSWIYPREGEWFHQPAYRLPNVVDTTGCGDSYHGAFLFGLLKGMALEQVASLASAVAALNSQHLGGRTGLPTFEQVNSFLASRPGVG
jgi:sulfofructose kinase